MWNQRDLIGFSCGFVFCTCMQRMYGHSYVRMYVNIYVLSRHEPVVYSGSTIEVKLNQYDVTKVIVNL